MTRKCRLSGALGALVVTVLWAAAAARVDAEDKPIRWDGGGNTRNWSDGYNWNPNWGGGPANDGYWEFLVTIGCPGTYDPNFDVLTPVQITDFFLCNDSRLVVIPNTALTVLRNTQIDGIIDGRGGSLTACGPSVEFPGNRARFLASNGSIITICAPTYSAAGLNFATTLMSASGPGTNLNLAALVGLDDCFDAGGSGNIHRIEAVDEGHINLQGLASIQRPTAQEVLSIEVNTGGTIDLSALQEIKDPNALGTGRVLFRIPDSSSLLLPALQTLDNVIFDLDGGALLCMNGPDCDGNGPDAVYSSARLNFAFTLMSASGPGTNLNLAAPVGLDDRFDAGGSSNIHRIEAVDEGHINLSGLLNIVGPTATETLEFSADGGYIDMSALPTITTAGSGSLRFDVDSGSLVDLSALRTITSAGSGSVRFNIGADSLVKLGSLHACGQVAVTLSAATARLYVNDLLRVGGDFTMTAPAGGTIRIGGDFLYTHHDVADLSLGRVHVECVGESQLLEVGGTNFGPSWGALLDDNFGFAQLTVGQDGQATTVGLVDVRDNLEPGAADVLYLFGVLGPIGSGGAPGLRIRGGSTLKIGNLNVYARLDTDGDNIIEQHEGVWIQNLFGSGQTIPFDEGFISRVQMYARGDLNCDGHIDFGDIDPFVLALGGQPPYEAEFPLCHWLNADCNNDGAVDFDDIDAFVDLLVGC